MQYTKLRLFFHQLVRWEYWSAYIIYFPAFFLWVVYFIRFRSFRFYKYSNPSINWDSYYNVNKMNVYQKLSKENYPKTHLVRISEDNNFEEIVSQNHFSFPLITKPNYGYRGRGVATARSIEDIKQYAENIGQDFLLQEMCDYENEMGVFYCKMPNQEKGFVTGITMKTFLTIQGDGIHTLEYFIRQNARHYIQLEKLRTEFDLQMILPNQKTLILVPYGNHNRGTKFVDGTHILNDKLKTLFDKLLSKIEGFYYGRLDLRYKSIKELEQGKCFSIIELNAASSEPTHIYDPKHSFYYGQKEIFRHQFMFAKIVSINRKKYFS